MSINLITGQPRNGKSQRMMAQVLDVFIKENDKREKDGKDRRKIYIDIDGVNAPETHTKLDDCVTDFERDKIWFGEHDDPDAPDDYWKPPLGSIFVFDECHKRYWVRDTSGSVSREPATISLNEHGHAGHDIWLLTQFPQYIHTHIRGLIQEHWHIKRIMNMNRAKVYKWSEFYLNPRTESAFSNAYEVEIFSFKKKYQKTYKSASAHAPIKFSFPKRLILPLVSLFFLLIIFINFSKDSMFVKNRQEQQEQKQTELENNFDQQNRMQHQEIESLKAELDELKQKYLPDHIAILAEHEDVRPAMVIASDKHCRVYNTYGEPMIIADGLCKLMNEYPSMIPRPRQEKQTPQTAPIGSDIFGVSSSSSQNDTPAVRYFDHQSDF